MILERLEDDCIEAFETINKLMSGASRYDKLQWFECLQLNNGLCEIIQLLNAEYTDAEVALLLEKYENIIFELIPVNNTNTAKWCIRFKMEL